MTLPSGNPVAFPRACLVGCVLALIGWVVIIALAVWVL